MKSKRDIYKHMNAHELCVISTLGDNGQPQAAVVGFGQTEELQLVFATATTSRKARNIEANGAVAVVIGWEPQGTVQYEGTARQLEGDEATRFGEVYFAKNPAARKYRDLTKERFYVVEPKWIRFTDITARPWDITELTF